MVVMADGSEGMRWNPSALARLENKEISGTHVEYYQDTHIENVNFGYPLEEGGLGAQLFYLSAGTLDGRNAVGAPTGDFKFYDLYMGAGYGRKLMSASEGMEVLAGASVKLVQEKIDDQSFQNPALDLGIQVSPNDQWKAGAAARNLSTSKANYPKQLILATSYQPLSMITGAAALSYSNDAPIRLTGAGEYHFEEWNSALRVSYTTHDEVENSEDSTIKFLRGASLAGLAMGAGFDYKTPLFAGLSFQVDYALAPFGALGISHTVTLKARW